MQVLRSRSGTHVAGALVFVALPAVVLALTDEQAQQDAEAPPWARFTMEEIKEHMTWDEEGTDKRREWVQNSRQTMAIALAKRLRLGKGGVFGGYELLVEDMIKGIPKPTDGSKPKEPKPKWRHSCLNANTTYDRIDQCAGRMLLTLGSLCTVQADQNTAQPFLKKTIKEHMKVINSGMVYELGMLRKKNRQGTVWGLSPALLTDMMQTEARQKDEIVTEAAEFQMHLLIQACMMYVYFSCASALGIQQYWEQGEELFKGITSHYSEDTWEKVGVPQDQAYALVRILGQSIAFTKGHNSAVHEELQTYMNGYTNFVWGYWQQWMESGTASDMYNGCEGLVQGLSWQCVATADLKEELLLRNERWIEEMLSKHFQQISPPPETLKQMKESGNPMVMVHSCGVNLFFSSWVKISKSAGMTIQFFRDMKTAIHHLQITQERFDRVPSMEKLKDASALVGSLLQVPQIMAQTKRFTYRLDDTTDCMDALGLALQIVDDPPPNMPLKPMLPQGSPILPSKGVPQDFIIDDEPSMDDFNLGTVNEGPGIHAEL